MRVQRITKEQLKERLDRGDAPTIVDVRLKYPFEHSALQLPGAIRVPPDAIGSAAIPRDKDVVLYDSDPGETTGARLAVDLLGKGYRVSVLKGGLPEWLTANLPAEPRASARAVPAAPGSPNA